MKSRELRTPRLTKVCVLQNWRPGSQTPDALCLACPATSRPRVDCVSYVMNGLRGKRDRTTAEKRLLPNPMRYQINSCLRMYYLGCGRFEAQNQSQTPAAIIGTHSHWPMLMPSARMPRKSSGSRKNSAMKRKMP